MQKGLSLRPQSIVVESKQFDKRREDLLHDIEMCQNDTRLVVRLKVISKAIRFFADQMRWENTNKVRMMAICERDRLRRLGRKIPDDSEVDTVRPIGTFSR